MAEAAEEPGRGPPSDKLVDAGIGRPEPAPVTVAHAGPKASGDAFDPVHRREADAPDAMSQADRGKLGHEFKALPRGGVRRLLQGRWRPTFAPTPEGGIADGESIAAGLRVAGGIDRLLHRLPTRIGRVLEINELEKVAIPVAEAARESLTIRTGQNSEDTRRIIYCNFLMLKQPVSNSGDFPFRLLTIACGRPGLPPAPTLSTGSVTSATRPIPCKASLYST